MSEQERKNNQIKALIKRVYYLLSIALAFLSAVLLWYYNVAPGWSEGFFGTRTLITVGIVYSITYYFFARMYAAFKIGLYRLVELSFSQMLAYTLTDGVLFIATFFWFHNLSRVRIRYFVLAVILQFFIISAIIWILNRCYARFDSPRKVCIIYGDQDYRRLIEKMQSFPNRYAITTCIRQDSGFQVMKEALGQVQDVYLSNVSEEVRVSVILFARQHGIDVHVSMDLDDILMLGDEISHSFDTPYFRNRKVPEMWYYPIVKRAGDIVISLFGLLITSPVLLIVAAAIKLEDQGPVFYRQKRLTKDGRVFNIIKFRSMKQDSEAGGAQLSNAHDSRITRVGRVIRKCRIDEIPQLFNILRGDMTLVGPRPERPEIAAQYEEKLPEFSLRLQVKAGLTGYAQVYGKYNTVPADKLKLDLIYIAYRSVLFDLRIIFYTLKIIFIPESTEGIPDGQKTAMGDDGDEMPSDETMPSLANAAMLDDTESLHDESSDDVKSI